MYKTDDGILLSEEQSIVLREIETNTKTNYFITGKAGTGKSVLLRAYVERAAKAQRNVVVLAPTGLAALNIGGQTLHSFLKEPPTLMDVDDYQIKPADRLLYRAIDTIVVDEISMVRVDTMDMLDTKLRDARENDLPFGGCQIISFGDLYQLPPVLKDGRNGDISEQNIHSHIMEKYKCKYFFAAPAVQNHPFIIIELKTVVRQKDLQFVDALNAIRVCDLSDEIMDYINQRCLKCSEIVPNETTYLGMTRRFVNRINKANLDAIKSEKIVRYQGKATGKFQKPDWQDDEKYNEGLPSDFLIELKVGARVIMVNNDSSRRWVNGTPGTIVGLDNDAAEVNINGKVYTVRPYTWEKYGVYFDPSTNYITKRITGGYTQLPIRLAYALTVHKAQGQTLDCVNIGIKAAPPFAPGQMYVALSRCRLYEGLKLDAPTRPKDIIKNLEVDEYLAGQFLTEVKDIKYQAEDGEVRSTKYDNYDYEYEPENEYKIEDCGYYYDGKYYTTEINDPSDIEDWEDFDYHNALVEREGEYRTQDEWDYFDYVYEKVMRE